MLCCLGTGHSTSHEAGFGVGVLAEKYFSLCVRKTPAGGEGRTSKNECCCVLGSIESDSNTNNYNKNTHICIHTHLKMRDCCCVLGSITRVVFSMQSVCELRQHNHSKTDRVIRISIQMNFQIIAKIKKQIDKSELPETVGGMATTYNSLDCACLTLTLV
jgi:hypothetical protein